MSQDSRTSGTDRLFRILTPVPQYRTGPVIILLTHHSYWVQIWSVGREHSLFHVAVLTSSCVHCSLETISIQVKMHAQEQDSSVAVLEDYAT